MITEIQPPKVNIKRRGVSVSLIILLVVCNLALSIFGGIVGFSVLANSNSKIVQNIRKNLGIDKNSSVALPLKQTVVLEESSQVIDASKKVMPATVSIIASTQVMDFFGRVSDQESAGGTGFILTSDGLIVTNKHVVNGTGSSYKVILNDGRSFDATIKAEDTLNDLAILKIEAKDLPVVEIGSSDALQIGQYVVAIGNALGEYKNSVTLGVVSAKQRSLQAGSDSSSSSESLNGLIQTDASINPGNSGGPLINLKGQVVGINTAIATTTGASVGIGFAIAIDTVKSAINSVLKNGTIIRPYLGVRYLPVTPDVQKANNLSVDYGALVTRGQTMSEVAVIPGSPADKAGLIENDLILEVNGEKVDQDNSLPQRVGQYQVGDQITLKVLRKGSQMEVKVTLEKMPS